MMKVTLPYSPNTRICIVSDKDTDICIKETEILGYTFLDGKPWKAIIPADGGRLQDVDLKRVFPSKPEAISFVQSRIEAKINSLAKELNQREEALARLSLDIKVQEDELNGGDNPPLLSE